MKKESTVKVPRVNASDRVLEGSVKRLRRLGTRRGSPEVKAAYRDAAERIKKILKKR